MSDNQFKGFGKLGFERSNIKVEPIGNPKPEDVEEQIYIVLHQSGYALRALDTPNGKQVIALCRMNPIAGRSFTFEVVKVMIGIIPEYFEDQPDPKGIMMPVASGKNTADLFKPQTKVIS